MPDLPRAAGLAYREAGPSDGPAVLLVHGWPESSHMWSRPLRALGEAGFRAVAPDLPGYGSSPLRRPATWALHVEALETFRRAVGLDRVALVVHDWGGLIGLRWACEHPDAVTALSISDSGFFPDGKWHGMAKAMREPGTGEELVAQLTPEGVAGILRSLSPGMDEEALAEYGRAFATEDGRHAALDLYRSGNFEELAEHDGKLAALGVPTLVLWGEDDPFAPLAGAHRLVAEIPGAELDVIPGTGHFVVDDQPDVFAERLIGFLQRATMSA
ncbi:alpha/beta fold hydrolase [Paraconexibacter sp.]|uniref:alpha/beta fold hydrolase n=1 Tax=Paraconexibacter sp. TaxID=2949640 RepID=UPI003565248E